MTITPRGIAIYQPRILEALGHGEMSIRDICIAVGAEYPKLLESVRQCLNKMEKRGLVVKAMRPSQITRSKSYYSLPIGFRE